MPEEAKRFPIIAAKERGPGPSRYKLPTCVGYLKHDPTKRTMPAVSFGRKLDSSIFRNDCSPGPSYMVDKKITRFGVDGTPMYSILGRSRNANVFQTPSPHAYHRENVFPQGETKAPVYSMGSRTRYRKRDSNPSSNTYILPTTLGYRVPNKKAAPGYSMGGVRGAAGGFAEDLAKAPGPGRYNEVRSNVYVDKAPSYSMLGKSYMTGDTSTKPGPGAHKPERVYINKPCAPRFSMGIKHSEYEAPLIVEIQE